MLVMVLYGHFVGIVSLFVSLLGFLPQAIALGLTKLKFPRKSVMFWLMLKMNIGQNQKLVAVF